MRARQGGAPLAKEPETYSATDLAQRENNFFTLSRDVRGDAKIVVHAPRDNDAHALFTVEAEDDFCSDEREKKLMIPSGGVEGSLPEGRVAARFAKGDPAVVISGAEIHFAFDPAAALENLLFERYVTAKKPVTASLPVNYRHTPKRLRMLFHRMITNSSRATAEGFPRWPIETAADTLRDFVARVIAAASGGGEPRMPQWPEGNDFVITLSHDLDSAASFRAVKKIAKMEETRGLRSCWFVVGNAYKIDRGLLRRLADAGHEIALHGYNHDTKLAYLSEREIRGRLDACADLAAEFGMRGIRSPALLVSDSLYSCLRGGFDWSSSVPSTDVESVIAARRGACTVYPFYRGGVLEIPLTVPLDDRLLTLNISGNNFLRLVMRVVKNIEVNGGVVCLGNHPEPHLSGGGKLMRLYESILDFVAGRDNAWHALPSQLCDFWNSFTGDSTK